MLHSSMGGKGSNLSAQDRQLRAENLAMNATRVGNSVDPSLDLSWHDL